MLSVTLAHTRVREGRGERKSGLEIQLASKAVKAVNQQIVDPSRAGTVANIWTVASIAYFSEVEELRTGKLPRQSFLSELQILQIIGRAQNNRAYYRGFLQLIQSIGGLEAIGQPEIAASLS